MGTIKRIFSVYYGKENIMVSKSKNPQNDLTLYNFTNEPKKINYSQPPFHFGMSGDFIKDENTIIKEFLTSSDKENFVSSIGGIFTFSLLYENQFIAWNNITRAEPIYWCETPDKIVVGTKALLVHLIAHGIEKPEYEINALTSFINNGFFCDETTPYKGVNILERNSQLKVENNNVYIKQIDDFHSIMYSMDPDKQFYDEITDLFLDSFSYLKKHDNVLKVGLTGGKDSRLVVAAMNALDLNFETSTNGYDDTADVIIAKKIANQLGLPHRVVIPSEGKPSINVDLFNRTVNTIKNSEGMLYSYENLSGLNPLFNSNKIRLGGQGGEIYRGGYAKKFNIPTKEKLYNHLLSGFARYRNFVQKNQISIYTRFLEEFIEKQPSHLEYNDILNSFYLSYRAGRWSASASAAYTLGYYTYPPFFENKLVKKAQLLKTYYGSSELLIYNILLRIAPELVDIPFAEDRWSFEKDNPYSRYQLKNWIARKPVYSTSAKGGFNWRKNVLNNYKDQFYEVIFHDDNSPLFDVIHKQEVKKLFNTKVTIPARYDTFLWSLYTASILLSNKWFNNEKINSRIKVNVPKENKVISKKILRDINPISIKDLNPLHKKLSVNAIGDYSALIEWNNFEPGDRLYFQTFDNAFSTPPSETFKEKSSIKGDELFLYFEIEKHLPHDFIFDVFFMQYNDEQRVYSEKESFHILEQQKIYKHKIKKHPMATNFKIAFKVSEPYITGKFSLHQVRIDFYK